jgi:ornithine cyclodeaminase/alanine dehydrogenase
MYDQRFLYLTQKDVIETGFGVDEVIATIEKALIEHVERRVEMPPKPGVHPLPDTFLHAMPAYVPNMQSLGMKWISCFPENYKHGLQQTLGIIALNDIETGILYSVMDCAWITAQRTAAITAIAAKHLARKESEVLGVVGAGVQCRASLIFLSNVMPALKRVQVYDLNKEAVDKFIRDLSQYIEGEIVAVDTAQKAVAGCDIYVSATKVLSQPQPFVKDEWFKNEGVFYAPLEIDSAIEWETIKRMDKFLTDDWKQTNYFATIGCFPNGLPELYAELGEVVKGAKPGRENARENNMIIAVGMAIEDITLAKKIYDRAVEKDIGIKLDL